MRRRRLAAAGVACLALCGAAAVLAATLLLGDEPAATPPAGPVVAVATIAPREHFPGDPVTATLALTVDARAVDPAQIEVEAGFRPYTRVGPVEIERAGAGDVALVSYVYRLQCLDRACVLAAGGGTRSFAPAVVRYPDATVGQATLAVDWPPVTIGARVSADDVGQPQFRAARDPVAPSYGISPGVLTWLLAGAAAVLVLVAGGLGARRLLRAGPAPVAARETLVDESVEAALAEVARTRAGDEDERRIALDTLARTLDRHGHESLAREARRLAWSRATPEGTPLDNLLGAVGRTLGQAA